MSLALLRKTPLLLAGRPNSGYAGENGSVTGNSAPGSRTNRRFSLKKPTAHSMVPVDGEATMGVANALGKIPFTFPFKHAFKWESTVPADMDAYKGRMRTEMNWPMKHFSDLMGNKSFDMTIEELQEYYATPKDGVDFLYDSPAGSSENPLIIEQSCGNMFYRSRVYCKGMCSPAVNEAFRAWSMVPGPMFVCSECNAHMMLDGKEDVVTSPTETPLASEEMPPFEFLEPEFAFWMKRGFPWLHATAYDR